MDKQGERPETRKGEMVAGFAILACIAVFFASAIAAVVAWGDNDWQGGGTCLVAAALSAGFLLNAIAQ